MVVNCGELWEWVLEHWAFCAFIIGIVFEVPKWRQRPFTAIFKWIGNHIVMDVNTKLTNVEDKITTMEESIKDIKIDMIEQQRFVVLDFANSCRNGRPHTKEEFDYIIGLVDQYQAYVEKYNIKNGQFVLAYQYIIEKYNENMKNNTFLA